MAKVTVMADGLGKNYLWVEVQGSDTTGGAVDTLRTSWILKGIHTKKASTLLS